VTSDALGDIYYYDSVRVNLGLFQHDVNVIWDLAVHDLAIMDHVLPVQPCADRKSTRLNSSHGSISYAVFCLKKKKLLTQNEKIRPILAQLEKRLLSDPSPSTNDSSKN